MQNRILIFGLLVLLSISLNAQTSFVYIDVSANIDRDLLRTELQLTSENLNNFIYFISNDNAPLIGNSRDAFNNHLNDLSIIKPSIPTSYNEIDTMLTLLINVKEPITLMFYFGYNYAKTGGIQNLVERLLLVNGWLNKDGLKNNVKIKLFFQRQENLTIQQINEISKNGKYEILIY